MFLANISSLCTQYTATCLFYKNALKYLCNIFKFEKKRATYLQNLVLESILNKMYDRLKQLLTKTLTFGEDDLSSLYEINNNLQK